MRDSIPCRQCTSTAYAVTSKATGLKVFVCEHEHLNEAYLCSFCSTGKMHDRIGCFGTATAEDGRPVPCECGCGEGVQQCCKYDHNYDGNCHIHSAPGVLRIQEKR